MPPFQDPTMNSSSPPPVDSASCAKFVPPPPPREVATGVSNLGNTCYMNAALQALAHAPELCHALDAEAHVRRCPIAARNSRRRRRRALLVRQSDSHSESSASSCAEKKSPKKKKNRDERRFRYDPNLEGDEEDEFCTLCELERLLGRIHLRPELLWEGDPEKCVHKNLLSSSPQEYTSATETLHHSVGPMGPVVPETFVTGFMSHVAPWFRRGVQEDSHEFLRLLIDAMQNSCKIARQEEKSEVVSRLCSSSEEDVEYPFRLFRGTVESNVTCSACRAVSVKIDPIEDIGLDILPVKSNLTNSGNARNIQSSRSTSNSRSTSPTSNLPLAAVQEALERFISIEHLDSGYKCQKCGRLGKATKTSKLASIPPILTLHLKRFRYGSLSAATSSGGSSNTNSSRSSRSAPRADPSGSDYVGPSGSAKIEGHVAFKYILDIKPYLTPKLQETTFHKAFCRLFAVVVHSGKNSHAGHYVAYVNSLSSSSKEWWKMDDAKVCRASLDEVLHAEAYMLFYRVVDHPVSKQLVEVVNAKAAKVMAEIEASRIAEEERLAAAATALEKAKAAASVVTEIVKKSIDATDDKQNVLNVAAGDDKSFLGKRKRPELASGEEWAKAMTCLPADYYPMFQQIQDFISDNVTFQPEFFTYITEEYNQMTSKLVGEKGKKTMSLLGKGPGGVYPPDDVLGGVQDLHEGILDVLHQIAIVYKSTVTKQKNVEGGSLFLLPQAVTDSQEVSKIPPALSNVEREFIIPEAGDGFECYDGAL